MPRDKRGNREGSKPRLRKDGRWTMKLTWTDDDGVRHRTQVYAKTQVEVRRKMKDVIRRLDEGAPAKDASITMAAYAREWMATTLAASDRKPSTKAGYASIIEHHVIASDVLGARPIDRVRPSTIEAFVVELRAKGLSQSTVRSAYTITRLILQTAVRDGMLAKNPMAPIKRPTVEHREAEYLRPDQVKALLEAAADSRYGLLFTFLVYTGMRRGEALALRWRDVNLDEGKAFVRGTLARVDGDLSVSSPKTRASKRMIDLSDAAVDVLRRVKARTRADRLAAGNQWAGDNELVFVTEFGTATEPRNALRALTAATKAAGIVGLEGNVGLHTLRHTAAALMLMTGVPMLVVSRHLGHTSITVTVDLYGHVAPDSSRAAVDALAGALG